MFGRSGQMFPRRAYHDAIYEQEYGSDQEDDCCRGRGLAGVLCWFLSVIILIGLAASVILTVFFVLKSRNLMGSASTPAGDDLDLLYGYGNPTSQNNKPNLNTIYEGTGLDTDYYSSTAMGSSTTTPSTTTTRTTTPGFSYDFTSTPSQRMSMSTQATVSTGLTSRTRRTTTTTVTPPTRRRVQETSTRASSFSTTTSTTPKMTERVQLPTATTKPSMFQFIFDTMNTYKNPKLGNSREPISREETTVREDILSDESSNRRIEYSTSRPSSGQQYSAETTHVLFSMPPSMQTSTTTSMRRRPTRHPPLKTFSSTSTENSEQDRESASSERSANKSHQKYEKNPPSTSTSTSTSKPTVAHAHTPDHAQDDVHDHAHSHTYEHTQGTTHSQTYDHAQGHAPATQSHRNHYAHDNDNTQGHAHDNGNTKGHVHDNTQGHTHDFRDDHEPPATSSIPSSDSTSTASTSTTVKNREDLLARIIKNLAPKFRNRTEIFSSIERSTPSAGNLRIRTKIRKPTSTTTDTTPKTYAGVTSSSNEKDRTEFKHSGQRGVHQPIEIVQAPAFVSENLPSTTDNQFLDILVGSEDHKTLFTKETDAGIITSAILPPWYVNETTGNETLTSEGPIEGPPSKPAKEPEPEEPMNSSASSHHTVQDMGQLFKNIFSNSDSPSVGSKFSNSRVSPDQQAQETQRPSFKDLLKELSPIFPSSSSSPAKISENMNPFHYGPGTGFNYYPEEPAHGHGQAGVQEHIHHSGNMFGHGQNHGHGHFQTPTHDQAQLQTSDQDPDHVRFEQDPEDGEELENSPSHVIDIQYDPKTQPEIIIEPDAPSDYSYGYGDFLHEREPLSAGSEIQPQIVSPPPQATQPVFNPIRQALRRPVTTPETEQSTVEQTRVHGQDIQLIAPALAETDEANKKLNQNAETGRRDETQILPAQEPAEPNAAEEDDTYESNRDELKQNSNERLQYDEYEQEFPPISNGHSSGVILERQPVLQLDKTLYRQSQLPSPRPAADFSKRYQSATSEPTTTQKVHEIYAVSYTTTEKPDPVTTTKPTISESNTPQNTSGFVAPELINFHSNVYSFKPSVSSGGFLPTSGESWRPVLYDSAEGTQQSGPGRFQESRPIPIPIQPSFQYPPAPTPTTPAVQQDYDQSVEEANSIRQEAGKPAYSPSRAPIKPSQPIPSPPQAQTRLKFPYPEPQDSSASGIDRSKYLYRPAPPPIVMRRTPQQSMPYLPNRRKTSPTFPRIPPHYLNQQQQIQQQQMLKQRLFQQHLARMRKRGNIQWPNNDQQQHNMDSRLQQHYPQQPPSRRQG